MNATAAAIKVDVNLALHVDVVGIDAAKYIGFAKWCTRRFLARNPHAARHSDDLHSEAMLALVTSATRFDPDRGVLFTRYAGSRIAGRLAKRFLAICRQEAHTVHDHNLDATVTVDREAGAADAMSAEAIASALVGTLPDDERAVVEAHYLNSMSVAAIARDSDQSRGRVLRLLRRGLSRMRKAAAIGGVES